MKSKRNENVLGRIKLAAAFGLLALSCAQAGILRVPEQLPTIQAAIDAAEFGDTIQVSPGTYRESLTIQNRGIIVHGSGAGSALILGNGPGPVVRIRNVDDSVVIIGFTITGGSPSSDESGGGIDIHNASPLILQCEIAGNRSRSIGAGIAVKWSLSNPIILRNFIHDNYTCQSPGCYGGYGGGIFFGGQARGTVAENVISNNNAWASGGAIYCGSLSGSGFMVIPPGGSPVIYRNVIINNSSDFDAQVWIGGANTSAVLAHNVIAGNFTDWRQGGALYLFCDRPSRVINNAIVNNHCGHSAGYAVQIAPGSAAMDLRNNIVAFNSGAGIVAPSSATAEFNDVFENSRTNYEGGIVGGDGSLSLDPLFVDQTSPDYHLAAESPVIDAGDPRDLFRDSDSTRNDMGAYGGDKLPVGLPLLRISTRRLRSDVSIAFMTLANFDYRVEVKDMPGSTPWTLLADITGTGETVQLRDNIRGPGVRLYRIRLLP